MLSYDCTTSSSDGNFKFESPWLGVTVRRLRSTKRCSSYKLRQKLDSGTGVTTNPPYAMASCALSIVVLVLALHRFLVNTNHSLIIMRFFLWLAFFAMLLCFVSALPIPHHQRRSTELDERLVLSLDLWIFVSHVGPSLFARAGAHHCAATSGCSGMVPNGSNCPKCAGYSDCANNCGKFVLNAGNTCPSCDAKGKYYLQWTYLVANVRWVDYSCGRC